MSFLTLCKTSDIPLDSTRVFIVGNLQIAVFHLDDQFFAIDNRCPHAGASLGMGVVEGSTVACRIHHWKFNLTDGQRLDSPCETNNLRTFLTRINGDELQIELEPDEIAAVKPIGP